MNVKIVRFESIDSTSNYAKDLRENGEDVVVWAEMQTGGRGTKGRSFSSGKGGVYLSALRFYENFPASQAFQIMQNAAAAVCETLVSFGITPQIKWPNDIYVNGKKICGILIENTFSGANVSSSVVGIGVNVYNALEEELAEIATTMLQETGKRFSVEKVGETLIEKLFEKDIYKRYVSYVGWLGQEVSLLVGENVVRAKLISVDEQGNLHAETDGEVRRYAAAEISLRI
jgi:BirA family biotin operon repressor/biotin-[acetyl-CoA-carboxylase] ligase